MLKICSFFFLDATFIFLIRCCVYWKYKEFFTRKLVLQGSAIKLVIRSIYSCMTVRDSIGKCSQCCFCLESRSQNHSSFWSNFHLLHRSLSPYHLTWLTCHARKTSADLSWLCSSTWYIKVFYSSQHAYLFRTLNPIISVVESLFLFFSFQALDDFVVFKNGNHTHNQNKLKLKYR